MEEMPWLGQWKKLELCFRALEINCMFLHQEILDIGSVIRFRVHTGGNPYKLSPAWTVIGPCMPLPTPFCNKFDFFCQCWTFSMIPTMGAIKASLALSILLRATSTRAPGFQWCEDSSGGLGCVVFPRCKRSLKSVWAGHIGFNTSDHKEHQPFICMLIQITNYVTIRTPISHDITLSRRIGWTATIHSI